ncbi:hypothetical protein QTP88_023818 [Uroleucon formosanum]
MQDVRRAHQMFYEIPDKIKQDEIILRFVMINPVRRTRSHVFAISKKRVDLVCKKYFKTGKSPKENRGEQRMTQKYESQRKMVKAFISKLKPIESHYCRKKNTTR